MTDRGPMAKIEEHALSDGSMVYSVVLNLDGEDVELPSRVWLACKDEPGAMALLHTINEQVVAIDD